MRTTSARQSTSRQSTSRLALLLPVLALVLAACGSDGGDGDATTTTTAEVTTTTAAPTTTTTAAPPTTAAPATSTTTAGGLPTDPQAYATAFVEAWEVGDQTTALQLGTQSAVDSIFAFESGGAGASSLTGCEGAAGSSFCTFTAGGDPTVVVQVGNEAASQGQPQAVTAVQVTG